MIRHHHGFVHPLPRPSPRSRPHRLPVGIINPSRLRHPHGLPAYRALVDPPPLPPSVPHSLPTIDLNRAQNSPRRLQRRQIRRMGREEACIRV